MHGQSYAQEAKKVNFHNAVLLFYKMIFFTLHSFLQVVLYIPPLTQRGGLEGEDFLSLYFFISYILLTFAAVKQLAMTYPANSAQQRNFDFFAFFSALYLVVSDILLTHTHTGALSV